jgi:photosystem II stability/assembly factor-like uncharacterized protein
VTPGVIQTPTSPCFPNAALGFKVRDDGKILKTQNGGRTWKEQNPSVRTPLPTVFFVDSNTGWVAGDKGQIAMTTDGGEHWNLQSSNTEGELTSIYFVDKKSGWVVDSGKKIIATRDGGNTWTPLELNPNPGSDLIGIHFLDETTGFGFQREADLLSLRSGTPWSASTTPLPQDVVAAASPLAGFFWDAQTGRLAGTRGAIWANSDKNNNWIRIQTPCTADPHSFGWMVASITATIFVGVSLNLIVSSLFVRRAL